MLTRRNFISRGIIFLATLVITPRILNQGKPKLLAKTIPGTIKPIMPYGAVIAFEEGMLLSESSLSSLNTMNLRRQALATSSFMKKEKIKYE